VRSVGRDAFRAWGPSQGQLSVAVAIGQIPVTADTVVFGSDR
jgi:hypothetical protein